MKARRSSRVACGHYVLVGQLIVNRGDGWKRYVLAARGLPSQPSQRPGNGQPAGDAWDGSGTEDDSAIRPAPEQQHVCRNRGGTRAI